MTRLSFGLRIPPCTSPADVAACARAAEDAGFDVVWLPDSQFLWRDVWATAAVAATATRRIVIGSCVTNFATRHVSVTASAAATLWDLAPRRVILGVGSGDSAVKTVGVTPTRLAAMRDQVAVARRLLSGGDVAFAGRSMRIRHAPGSVPIYLAANGPRALELAGEVGDGVITVSGLGRELIERSGSVSGSERLVPVGFLATSTSASGASATSPTTPPRPLVW
jgi:5,10-methylenetetrahydromethanopterin reductase